MDFWCRDLKGPLWVETVSQHEIDVATLGSLQEGRDLDKSGWCRDTDLMSRHGSACMVVVWCRDPIFEVATWAVLVGRREVATWD